MNVTGVQLIVFRNSAVWPSLESRCVRKRYYMNATRWRVSERYLFVQMCRCVLEWDYLNVSWVRTYSRSTLDVTGFTTWMHDSVRMLSMPMNIQERPCFLFVFNMIGVKMFNLGTILSECYRSQDAFWKDLSSLNIIAKLKTFRLENTIRML